MNIERTLFWFKDGDDKLLFLNDRFFQHGILLNRLLNEKYNGKKIKFLNIDFSTERTYLMYPVVPRNSARFYGGHLRYYGIIDLEIFNELDEPGQIRFIWEKAYEYLQNASEYMKNDSLLEACRYAYIRGSEINFNADYRMIEADIVIYDQPMKAAVWVNFMNGEMYSKFTLEKDGEIIFERAIDKSKNGIEFFLIMYKRIEIKGNIIIIKGLKDVDYLPLKIHIEKDMVKYS